MSALSDTAIELLDYCKEGGRICPQPQQWHQLWEMLPDRNQESGGWTPSLPLILAAWWSTPWLSKILRLREHIEWADEHGAINEVDSYLRGLTENQWFHGRD